LPQSPAIPLRDRGSGWASELAMPLVQLALASPMLSALAEKGPDSGRVLGPATGMARATA
jgi:hypothetical protein